jgi:hypothetical protein
MQFTMTGAGGFIGEPLAHGLLADRHALHVLGRSRPVHLPGGVAFFRWDALREEPPLAGIDGSHAVIHLAGEPVAQRWTPRVKARIRSSRVEGTRRLVAAIAKAGRKPAVLVCASAIGYYGSRGDEILTEDSKPGAGFLPEVCVAWENAAREAEKLGLRVVNLRIGVVLGHGGGALARMLPPFRMGLGGPIGSGNQWMSWVHRDDLVALIRFAAELPALQGPVNATAPNPVTNAVFTRELAAALRRPAFLPTPPAVLRLLFGEMAEVLLASQRVVPVAAESAGFRFRYPQVGMALRNSVS